MEYTNTNHQNDDMTTNRGGMYQENTNTDRHNDNDVQRLIPDQEWLTSLMFQEG